jgi:hypothetical protein
MSCTDKEEILNWWDGPDFFIRVHNSRFQLARALFAKNTEADDNYMLLIAEFIAPMIDPGHRVNTCTLIRSPEVPSCLQECAMNAPLRLDWHLPQGQGQRQT